MADYIDRETVINWLRMEQNSHQTLGERMSVNEAVSIIEEMPTAAVAPVRHGRWVHTNWAYDWSCLDECSRCGYHDRDRKNLSDYVYCPMCGAIMDLEE